jgi:hypothetical protein
MGFGLLGLKGPAGRNLFVSSLLNHFLYGFGRWWTAALLPIG